MMPPTPERCPTCDREGCAVAAAAALVASLTIPVTPGENGCACYGEFSRSHNPSRGCEIHGTDGSAALEAAWAAERAAREDCHAHRVDWRARAIAAEVLVASYESPTCDHRHPCHCGSGGHPRRCMRHPKAFDAHCAELNVIAQEQNKLEEAQAAAARWAKVAPLIERLREAREGCTADGECDAVTAILAATEATP